MRYKSLLAWSTTLIASLGFANLLPVSAHGAVFPVNLTSTHFASKFALAGHTRASVGPSGVGSLSTRLNANLIKSIVTAGYSNGQNFAVAHELGGAISSGVLTGSFYTPSGATYNYSGSFNWAIGSNPYNIGGGGGFASSIPTGNSLTFVNGGTSSFKTGGGAGGALFGVKGSSIYSGISGAQRAQHILFKSIAGSSTYAGEKSIQSLGPITGGVLNGVLGEQGGANLFNFFKAAYIFGNNPLITPSFSPIPASQIGNYITFGNVTRQVSDGQFLGTLYTAPHTKFGTYGFSFGNSPFNTLGTFPISGIHNAINFYPLVLGHK